MGGRPVASPSLVRGGCCCASGVSVDKSAGVAMDEAQGEGVGSRRAGQGGRVGQGGTEAAEEARRQPRDKEEGRM